MNKKIIASIGALALIGTLGFANCQMQGSAKYHQKGGIEQKMLQMTKMLSLTDEQQTKVDEIVTKYLPKKPDMISFFTDSGFDKDKYLKMMDERKDMKMLASANIIKEVYDILDANQKVQLKTLIEAKQMMMQNKMGEGCDKGCNGRR